MAIIKKGGYKPPKPAFNPIPPSQKHEAPNVFMRNCNIGHILDKYIYLRVNDILQKSKNQQDPGDVIATDSFVEVLEKLIISHIRAWYLEDEARRSDITEEKRGLNRRKEAINNGTRRPRYVEALGRMFQLALEGKFSLKEDSVKMYEETGRKLINDSLINK